MIVDMANDSIKNIPININKSYNLVIRRIGTLILAALISAVFFLTFILIPIALFIITIAIVEKTDAIESTKRSFSFVTKNLAQLLVFVIISIVIWAILDFGFAYIPVLGAYLGAIVVWIVGTVLIAASLHFYLSLKQPLVPPPPPPPPPPQN
jgi:CDP-diglyceride synthetase